MSTIIITGHTSGIGKSLASIFAQHGHTIIGFSRSTGHNIDSQDVRDLILSTEADVFINNAYDPMGQTELLQGFIKRWEGHDKFIINLSSKLVHLPSEVTELSAFNEYIENKKTQNSIIASRHSIAKPKLLNIMPGLVDTAMASIFEANKINPTNLANLIYTLYNFRTHISIQEIVVDVPGLDWQDIKINLPQDA